MEPEAPSPSDWHGARAAAGLGWVPAGPLWSTGLEWYGQTAKCVPQTAGRACGGLATAPPCGAGRTFLLNRSVSV